MKTKNSGWVIINENHPNNPNAKQIFSDTFSYTKKECIKSFIKDSGNDWNYWRRKYNFRAVKATLTIVTKT